MVSVGVSCVHSGIKLYWPQRLFVLLAVAFSNGLNYGNEVGISPLLKYILYVGIYPIIINRSINIIRQSDFEKIIRKILSGASVACTFFIVFLLLMFVTGNASQDELGNYYIYNYHKNASGALLYFSAGVGFIVVFLYRSPLGLVNAAFALFLMLITGARAYFLATLLILILCLIRGSRYRGGGAKVVFLFAFSVFISACTAYYIFPGQFDLQFSRFSELLVSSDDNVNSSNSRFVLWSIALDDFLRHPFFGTGFGGFKPNLGGFFFDITEPHNGLLQIAGQGGAVGLGAFLLLLYFGLILNLNNTLSSSQILIKYLLIFYLCAGMVGIIWVRGDGHVFWLFFWLYAISNKKLQELKSLNFDVRGCENNVT